MTSAYAFDKSILWNIGIKPEVRRLLETVNPNWEQQLYITTEFYLDPIQAYPEDFKFLAASPKTRQKWYISHYLTLLKWTQRTPNNKTSVLVNPNYIPPKRVKAHG